MPRAKVAQGRGGQALSKNAKIVLAGVTAATVASLAVMLALRPRQGGTASASAKGKGKGSKRTGAKQLRRPRPSARSNRTPRTSDAGGFGSDAGGDTPVTGQGMDSAGLETPGAGSLLSTCAAELVVFAPSSRRRDRLKRSHLKNAVKLLELVLARQTAEEADELECSLLFRCIVGYSKWRVLFAKPGRKGVAKLLLAVAASHDRSPQQGPRASSTFGGGGSGKSGGSSADEEEDDDEAEAGGRPAPEPTVALTCISVHSGGHSARAALASLQLSGHADGATEQAMAGQVLFSKKWLNSTRRAEFDGIALDGQGDLAQGLMMSRNLSMRSPGTARGGTDASGVQLRATVVPRSARYNQLPTNFFAQLNRWSAIVEVEGALRAVNEAAKQAKGWGTAKEGLRGLVEELREKQDEESKKQYAALSLAARVIARYGNFAWISTRKPQPPPDRGMMMRRRQPPPPDVVSASVKDDGNIVVFTAPDCISRSGLARVQEEHAKTEGGVLTWISGNELFQRVSAAGPSVRSGVDGVMFNPPSFAAEDVGSEDVVLSEKQFRGMHTVRWTVGFVKLVADLAA